MEQLELFISDELPDIIVDCDGIRVAGTYGDNRTIRSAIAERVVKCWNFFVGVETANIPYTPLSDNK